MSIIQCNYFRLIKFCVITIIAFSLFACDDVLKALTDIKSHTTAVPDNSQESEELRKYKKRKQDKKWEEYLASHLFAGSSIGKRGFREGQGSDALFSYPLGMTADARGNIYIADSGNHVIRLITPEGEVTTVAGQPRTKGFRDGSVENALFNNPTKLIMMSNGVIYVLDTGNHKIRKIVGDTVSTVLGGAKGYKDNPNGTEGVQFEYPKGFQARSWSPAVVIKNGDPHKKYGAHTDITIYDGPDAKRWRMIVLKDGEIQSVETIQKQVRFNWSEYKYNGSIMILDNALIILDPTEHALFKFPFSRKKN